MVRVKMAQNLKEAVTFVEQGHIRIGVSLHFSRTCCLWIY